MDNQKPKKFRIKRKVVRKEASSVRLHVFLARAGIASRRKCEEYISQGLVMVNGKIVTELGTKVSTGDIVLYQGRQIHTTKLQVYIALNKPPKFLSSNSDPDGRPLAVSLLKQSVSVRVYPVGRLDYLSSGLLFFTNDGEFAKIVSHPSSEIEKEYLVETKKEIPEELLKEYLKGIYIEGELYKLKNYMIRSPKSVRLILLEGKNREIRKVFASKGLYPKRIHRIRIGSVLLKGIDSGKYRNLTSREINSLIKRENKKELSNGSGD